MCLFSRLFRFILFPSFYFCLWNNIEPGWLLYCSLNAVHTCNRENAHHVGIVSTWFIRYFYPVIWSATFLCCILVCICIILNHWIWYTECIFVMLIDCFVKYLWSVSVCSYHFLQLFTSFHSTTMFIMKDNISSYKNAPVHSALITGLVHILTENFFGIFLSFSIFFLLLLPGYSEFVSGRIKQKYHTSRPQCEVSYQLGYFLVP